MNWNERIIASAVAQQVLNRKCVVLVDRCSWTGYECDVLAVTTDLRVIDVEIKISRADLKADAKKDKWWIRKLTGYAPADEKHDANGRLIYSRREPIYDETKRQWPLKVWKHYYALPAEIWKPELLDAIPSPASGVILLKQQQHNGIAVANVARRANPCKDADRLKPEEVMDIARLANLRMWEAYAQRDAARSGVAA